MIENKTVKKKSTSNDEFRIIPLEERKEELEEVVRSYVRNADPFPEHKEDLPERGKEPVFNSKKEELDYWKEEIRRCRKGHAGMSGKMYFFYKYCFIRNMKRGAIRPEFRVGDKMWFDLVTKTTGEYIGWGIVCVKRRRVGMSWKEAADTVHDMMFNKYYNVGMNSKSEKDSEHLFAKVMFIYERLPIQLKAKLGRKNGMNLEFFRTVKNEHGEKKRAGNQSSLIVVAPTESAFEGLQLHKWVCDEAGRIGILPQLWSFTEDCLMEEYQRYGVPILFGTSGDISTNGGGLLYMWKNSDVYKLKRFFFPGYTGICVDEKGNDKIEEAIRWIIYERKRREGLDPKSYNDFIQRYPLTIDEAFSSSAGGLGNIVKINSQRAALRDNPFKSSRGIMKFSPNFESFKFTPEKFGPVIIWETPDPNKDYVIACDPADHDDVGSDASDLSLHVMTMPNGIEPPKIVLEYCERPQKVSTFYNNAIAICKYYNNTKILIERNRYGMIKHFETIGEQKLLEPAPAQLNKFVRVRPTGWGVHMTNDFKEYMKYLIEAYIDGEDEDDNGYCHLIPSPDLLREFTEFGSKNTDRVISFGLCLAMIKSRLTRGYKRTQEQVNRSIPTYKFVNRNGVIRRVNVKK